MKVFESKKVLRSNTVKLYSTPEVIFPLLCPVREEEWVPGWENDTYELVYSESGLNEEGCIFKASFLSGGAESIWTCLKYDRKAFDVRFLVYVKDLLIRNVNISLLANEDGTTNARFDYAQTAVSAKGNELIEGYTNEEHVKGTTGLCMMLNYFLQNGTKIKK